MKKLLFFIFTIATEQPMHAGLLDLPIELNRSISEYLPLETLIQVRQTSKRNKEIVQDTFFSKAYRDRHPVLWTQINAHFIPIPWQACAFDYAFQQSREYFTHMGPSHPNFVPLEFARGISENLEQKIDIFRAKSARQDQKTPHANPPSKKLTHLLLEIILHNSVRAKTLALTAKSLPLDQTYLGWQAHNIENRWTGLLDGETVILDAAAPHSAHLYSIPGRFYNATQFSNTRSLLEAYAYIVRPILSMSVAIEVSKERGFRSAYTFERVARQNHFHTGHNTDLDQYWNSNQNIQESSSALTFQVTADDFLDADLDNHILEIFQEIDWSEIRQEDPEAMNAAYADLTLYISRLIQLQTLAYRASHNYRDLALQIEASLLHVFSEKDITNLLEDFPNTIVFPERDFTKPLLITQENLYKHALQGLSLSALKSLP